MTRSRVGLGGAVIATALFALGGAPHATAEAILKEATLSASAGSNGSRFGASVAVSGDTVVVGAPQAGSGGVLYVFVRPGSGWADATETARLAIADGAPGDALGTSVAIDGDTIVAGAPGAQAGRGAVYVFMKPAHGWQSGSQTAQPLASDCAAGYRLGSSVGISGGTVVAGAPGARVGSNAGQGAAYLFVEGRGGWQSGTETAKLVASDGKAFDGLGSSAAVSGDTTVATGGGAAYVFAEPGTGWSSGSETAKLTATSRLEAVAIDGGVVAAGAVAAAGGAGAVEVFAKPGEPGVGWVNESIPDAELTASDGTPGDGLGSSVSVSGPLIVSGISSGGNIGAVYAFAESQPGWVSGHEAAKLIGPGGGSFEDDFGQAVATDGTEIEVGAPASDGAAYVYGQGNGGSAPPTTIPDPTTPPRYTPAYGATPPRHPPVVSARVTLVGSLLLLNEPARTIHAELLCLARARNRCGVRGALWRIVDHRPVVLGRVSLTIPGRRVVVVPIPVTVTTGRLRPASQPTMLTLSSSVQGLRLAKTNVPVIVRPLAPGKPPAVTTEAASGISPPGVTDGNPAGTTTLAGTVNPEGKLTRYHFELGTGPGAYDLVLPSGRAQTDPDELTHLVTVSAFGLLGGVTYHYRLVAENASGTVYGADRRFTVPLAHSTSVGLPVGDTTEAGPVLLQLSYICIPAVPPVVTGVTVQCTIVAHNPQPVAIPFGDQVVAARPAFVVLDALAAPGTVASTTLGPNAPIALSIPPGAMATATVNFTVEHPPALMPFVVLQANGPAAMSTLSAAQPRVRLSISCASGVRSAASRGVPGSRPLSCTITTANTGTDSADLSTFEIQPSPGLFDPRTTAGRPAAVLRPGASSDTTVRFNARPGTASATVTVRISGLDETDRLPFLAAATGGADG